MTTRVRDLREGDRVVREGRTGTVRDMWKTGNGTLYRTVEWDDGTEQAFSQGEKLERVGGDTMPTTPDPTAGMYDDLVDATAVYSYRTGCLHAAIRMERDGDRHRVRISTYGPYRERIVGPDTDRAYIRSMYLRYVRRFRSGPGWMTRDATPNDLTARAPHKIEPY